jgi:hypothetical protein
MFWYDLFIFIYSFCFTRRARLRAGTVDTCFTDYYNNGTCTDALVNGQPWVRAISLCCCGVVALSAKQHYACVYVLD